MRWMMGPAAALALALGGGFAGHPATAMVRDNLAAQGTPVAGASDVPAARSPVAPAPDAPPQCGGRDLMADLPADQRLQIDRAVAETPFSRGIRWTARRGNARIEMIGTYHFDDPRLEPIAQAMAPVVAGADALLVEAAPAEESALRAALARDPSLLFDPAAGGGVADRLGPADQGRLAQAMAARGIPAEAAARMRPWYLNAMLALSPCQMAQASAGGGGPGLDHRLIAQAQTAGVPVASLEPWDTVLRLFDALDDADAARMIRAALPLAGRADDEARTAIEAYLRGDIWAIWELSRVEALAEPGLDAAAVDRQQAIIEDRLMAGRNQRWIGPLTQAADRAAAQGRPVVAAFGALHLPGEQGVLRLLEQDGWTITPAGP